MKKWITHSRFGLITTFVALSSAFLCSTMTTASEPVWGGFDAYGPPCWPEDQGDGEGDGEAGGGAPDGEGGLMGPKPANQSDPVWMPHGEYLDRHTDLLLPGRGMSIEFTRSYRTRSALHAIADGPQDLDARAPLGIGWSHNYDQWITSRDSNNSSLIMYTGNERRTFFNPNSSWGGTGRQYEAANFHGVIDFTTTYDPMTYTTDDNTVYVFKPIAPYTDDLGGKLESITDRNGNTITLTYEEAGYVESHRLASVQDGLGNSITFTYFDHPSAPRPALSPPQYVYEFKDIIWKVTDHTGRTVEYLYKFAEDYLPNDNYDLLVRELVEVVLPPINQGQGVFDLPSEHARFPNGRSFKYEYFETTDRFTGLLTKVTNENGVEILNNHFTEPDSLYQDTYVRRIYKQDFAGDSYTYMITARDGNELAVDTFQDYSIWLQRRNGTVTEFHYTGSINGRGTFRLEERIDYSGTVPLDQRGKVVWKDTRPGVNQWYYADTPLSTKTSFSGPVNPKRLGDTGLELAKEFGFNDDWHQTQFVKPNGDVIESVYNDSADDARGRGALTSITTKPDGTILDNDGLPLSSHPDWITESFEYDFSFWSGVPGACSCSTGRFATASIDGNGNRTEKDYDVNGNVTEIRHDIPAGFTTPAAVETFTYTTGGNLETHTHPDTIRLVDGVPTPYPRVDEFEYHLPGHENIASIGKLKLQRIDKFGVTPLVTHFEYDAIGNISKITEPDGDIATYLYNQARQLVREQHYDQTQTVLSAQSDYFYDANGNLVIEKVSHLDTNQNVITTVYQYNERDQLVGKSVERETIQAESFTENSAYQATPTGSGWITQEWVYDSNGNLIFFKDGDAVANPSTSFNIVEYQYDFRDLLYRQIEGAGSSNELVVQFNYDENKRLIERITNPDSINGVAQLEVFGYDGHDRLISIADPMSNVAIFEYDKNHNQTEIMVLGPVDIDTDESGIPDTVDVLYKAELGYDTRDRLKTQGVSIFDYLTGAQSSVLHQITTYTYNEDSSIRKIESPSGVVGVADTVEYFYDTVGRKAHVEDGDGNVVKYGYDSDSNVSYIAQIDQSISSQTEQEFFVSYTYDSLDRRKTVTDGALNATEWSYDSRSNLVKEIDGRENVTYYDYDGLGRLVATRIRMTADGDGPETDPVLDVQNSEIKTQVVYDDSSRVIAEIDDNNQQTDYGYDAVNRRTTISLPGISPNRDVYTTEYNGNGMASSQIDARGVILDLWYDLNNRLIDRVVDELNGPTIAGSLSEQFVYDGLGRIRMATNDFAKVVREYDSRSNVLRETQNVDSINSFPMWSDRVVAYGFDGASNLSQINYPGGRVIDRAYDKLNRLATISDPSMTNLLITEFKYIGKRLERRSHGNGTHTDYEYNGYDGALVHIDDYGFGRVSKITTTETGVGTVLDSFSFRWDENQNRTSYNDLGSGMKNRRERSFGYDSSDRLVSTDVDFPDVNTDYTNPTNNGVTDYDLDGVHNRYSVTGFEEAGAPIGTYKDAAIDIPDHIANNQYTYTPHANGGTWINSYDENGNLIYREEYNISDLNGDYEIDFVDINTFLTGHASQDPIADINGDGQWDYLDIQLFLTAYASGDGGALDQQEFTYDFRNQLVNITLKSGADQTPVVVVTNAYDPMARRVMESVDLAGGGVVEKQMVYGCVSLWEVIEQIELGSETLLLSHVYGLGIDDEVSYRIENLATTEDFWAHRDDLNSLTSITDASGDVKERYQYGDYGQVTIFDPDTGIERISSEFIGATHLYTGRSLITGTGLFDLRNRVLDPETGQFRQRDPLGYIDSMNMYSYISNNPNQLVDPYGLSPLILPGSDGPPGPGPGSGVSGGLESYAYFLEQIAKIGGIGHTKSFWRYSIIDQNFPVNIPSRENAVLGTITLSFEDPLDAAREALKQSERYKKTYLKNYMKIDLTKNPDWLELATYKGSSPQRIEMMKYLYYVHLALDYLEHTDFFKPGPSDPDPCD